MSTDEVGSCTSRENLTWFQNRKERWIKSPRPKLKPIPTPATKSNGPTTTETFSTNHKSELLNNESAIQCKNNINNTASPIIAPVPSKPKPSQVPPVSETEKRDTSSSKGIFDNINLVPSSVGSIPDTSSSKGSFANLNLVPTSVGNKPETSSSKRIFANINLVPPSVGPTSSNVGAMSFTTLGISSGPTPFPFGTTPTPTESSSIAKVVKPSDAKISESDSTFFGGSSQSTFGVSSTNSPSLLAVAETSNTNLQKETKALNPNESVSKSIFAGASTKQLLGISSGSSPFTFGANTNNMAGSDSTTINTTSSTSLFGGSSKPTIGISASPIPFTSTVESNKGTIEIPTAGKDTSTTPFASTKETTSSSIFGLNACNPTLRSASSQQSPFSFGNNDNLAETATSSIQTMTTPTEDQSSSNATPTASRLESSISKQEDEKTVTSSDAQRRLIAFYQKYNPEKLDSVDATLEKYKGNEEELFKKLEAKYLPPPASKYPLPSGEGPVCFLEFSIGGEIVGKVNVKLFRNQVPLACDNFQALCNGSKGKGRIGKPLCYKHSKIHRVVPLFCVQMGDFTRGDGTGGESIYAPNICGVSDSVGRFKDETFLQHSKKGLLSMANNGPDRNGSQFFFTLRPCPNLDGKHVVFGEVVTGMEVIEKIGNLKTSSNQRPEQPVEITDCGEIVNGKEVSCQVALEKAPTPFSFGATTFGSGLGQSNSVGFGSLAASAQTSNVVGFGSASTGGSSAFSFGAVASSLQASGNDKAGGSGFSSTASTPAAFGLLGTNAGSTTTPVFGGTSAVGFATTSASKSSLGIGSTSSAFGRQDGPSSAFSFGSMSLNAQSSISFPTQSLNNSPGFALRAESKDVSESEDSSRDDNDNDSDDDE